GSTGWHASPVSLSTRAYAVESAPANDAQSDARRAAGVVLRRGLGRGLRGHQGRAAARRPLHLPHAAVLLRPAVPSAGGPLREDRLAAKPRRARPPGGRGAAGARRAAPRQP